MRNPQIKKKSKMVKKLKISKISKNHFFQKEKIEEEKKCQKTKCFPLSFPILGGHDSTRALQSSPFQNPGGVVRA